MSSATARPAGPSATEQKPATARYGGRRWLAVTLVSALSQQLLFSGANFVATILLVRWLPAREFASYSLSYSAVLLGVVLNEALVADPVPVFGPGQEAMTGLRQYSGVVFGMFAGLALVVSFALAAAAVFQYGFGSTALAGGLLGAAFAAPMLLFRSVAQQFAYTFHRPYLCALAGVCYAIAGIGGLVGLHVAGWLSPGIALVLLGGATGLPTLAVMLAVALPQLRWKQLQKVAGPVLRQHWSYGRWVTVDLVVQWVGGNAYYMVCPILFGLAGSAAIRPLFNLIMPVQMMMSAGTLAVLPMLSRARLTGDLRRARQIATLATMIYLAMTLTYFVVMTVTGARVIRLLYGPAIAELASPLVLVPLATVPVVTAVTGLLEAQLRAGGRARVVAMLRGVWTASMLTIGLGACVVLGFPGVYIGFAACSLVSLVATVAIMLRPSPLQTS